MTSAAEFVEGGVQDSCDDACSICLEPFCEDDPATINKSLVIQPALMLSIVFGWRLQCDIWSQRSRECPMCWRSLRLKHPDSQKLLNAGEQDQAIFGNKIASYRDEDCIMQHLSPAAVGSAHQMWQREHFPVCQSTAVQFHPNLVHESGAPAGVPSPLATSVPVMLPQQSPRSDAFATALTFPQYLAANSNSSSSGNAILRQRAVTDSQEHGHSTSESLETLKSRLVAVSSRYKETLTKNTRGFRERLRTRSGLMQDLGSRARDLSAGVVRALERVSLEAATARQDLPHTSPELCSGIDSDAAAPVDCISQGSTSNDSSSLVITRNHTLIPGEVHNEMADQ